MNDHARLDQRSLALAQAIVSKIDADATQAGFHHARRVLSRWLTMEDYAPDLELWKSILLLSWEQVRLQLLDTSEMGNRLRQSSPFTGILSTAERTQIFRRFSRTLPGDNSIMSSTCGKNHEEYVDGT